MLSDSGHEWQTTETLHGEEKEQTLTMLRLSIPTKSVVRKHAREDHYDIGGQEFVVTQTTDNGIFVDKIVKNEYNYHIDS